MWYRLFLTSLSIATFLVWTDRGRAEEKKQQQYNFVQTASSATFKDGKLTLNGISPKTVYFSDRPNRQVGQIENEGLVASWSKAANSLSADPPNASITYMQDGALKVTVLELRNPSLAKDSMTYSASILAGDFPSSGAKNISLFIDAGGLMQCVAFGC